MDKNKQNQPDVLENESLSETATEESAEENQSEMQPEASSVQVKRAGGGLSLLLSMLALAATAYLYYQNWQNNKQVSDQPSSLSTQQLSDTLAVLQTDLSNTQVDVKNLSQKLADNQQQIQHQLNELLTEPANPRQATDEMAVTEVFDNSSNEQAIDQLKLQMAQQSQLLATLNSKLNQSATPVLTDTTEQNEVWQQRAAVDLLIKSQVLIETQQWDAAIHAIDNFVSNQPLSSTTANALQQLNRQLKQLEQPELSQLRMKLSAVTEAVSELQLAVEDKPEETGPWYKNLITVKKIADEQAVNSSVALLALKTELKQILYQAGLYLTLQDQSGWTQALQSVKTKLNENMPKHKELINQVAQLANEQVVVVPPEGLNIQALINQIKGSN